MAKWKEAGNLQMVHDVFAKRISPLYFHLGSNLKEVQDKLSSSFKELKHLPEAERERKLAAAITDYVSQTG